MSSHTTFAGEEDIIQTFMAPLAAGMAGALGLKDDCSIAAPRAGYDFVFKTDAIAEGVHFLSDDPPADIGWKALAVNVSDLAAKGARPHGYLMSLSFPEAPHREWLAEFSRGLGEAQRAFGIGLLGGDTDRRPGPISITPMVIGEVPSGRMVRRTAAQPGDVVFVTGTLGDASLGLHLRLDGGKAAGWGLDESAADSLRSRYLRPQPRLALASALLELARASMDISDGLTKDLGRMCSASGCGAQIELEALPVSAAFAHVRARDPDACGRALFGGDDYEILCAVPADRAEQFGAAAAAVGVAVKRVGQFTGGARVDLRDGAGRLIEPSASGWDHF